MRWRPRASTLFRATTVLAIAASTVILDARVEQEAVEVVETQNEPPWRTNSNFAPVTMENSSSFPVTSVDAIVTRDQVVFTSGRSISLSDSETVLGSRGEHEYSIAFARRIEQMSQAMQQSTTENDYNEFPSIRIAFDRRVWGPEVWHVLVSAYYAGARSVEIVGVAEEPLRPSQKMPRLDVRDRLAAAAVTDCGARAVRVMLESALPGGSAGRYLKTSECPWFGTLLGSDAIELVKLNSKFPCLSQPEVDDSQRSSSKADRQAAGVTSSDADSSASLSEFEKRARRAEDAARAIVIQWEPYMMLRYRRDMDYPSRYLLDLERHQRVDIESISRLGCERKVVFLNIMYSTDAQSVATAVARVGETLHMRPLAFGDLEVRNFFE
jgi:hypothetical protein